MHRAKQILSGALAIFALSTAITDSAMAQGSLDRVRMRRGGVSGEIQSTTPLEVTVSRGSTGIEKIAVNEIRSIIFGDEPNELTQARVMIVDGRGYREALDRLERIDEAQLSRDLVKADVEFYQALSAAKLALSGKGDIRDAGRQMIAFVRKNKDSFHYLEACEALGELFVAVGSYDKAEQQYGELAKTPWPEYKARSSLLVGRALQSQNKHNEAIRRFDEAIKLAADGDEGRSQRLAATLGKAISQAASGEINQAVLVIEDVIADANPENVSLHALAYNALGNCYELANKPKDALLAYLHVDVLYSAAGDAHAEALSHIATLWEALGQDGRAREARTKLQENYASSRWAQ